MVIILQHHVDAKGLVERMKILKKTYIIGGGISIVLLLILIAIIIVFVTSSSSDDNPSTNPPITDPNEIPLPYTNALIVKIDNSTLWARNIDDDDSLYLIKNWNKTFYSFDFYRKKNIYFGSTIIGEAVTSYSRQFYHLSQPGIWFANKIAMDYIHDKLYVLDRLAGKINLFDIWNNYYNVISIDLYEPVDIAVDPIEKCLFVLQVSSLLKTNLDGTLPKTIVEKNDISTFQINVHESRIYWATRRDIQSVDYAGQNLITVEKINKVVISLAISRNKLFWLNPSNDDKKSILWLCKIINGTCKDTSSAIFDGNAIGIKAYNFDQPRVSNPCDNTRHCKHMCVNSNNKPQCVCNVGWQLKNDSRSCEVMDEFLLYVQGDFVKGRSLNFLRDSFTSAILPVQLNASLHSILRVLHFDFDVRDHEFVFSDDNSIHKMNLKPDSESIFIGGDSKYSKINSAYDWITRNIYYISAIHSDFYSIAVCNIAPYDNSIADYIVLGIHGSDVPRSLVVHPNRGYMFLTLQNSDDTEVKILRTTMYGTNKTFLAQNLSISAIENGLAIDYEENRLFWFDKDMKKLYSADLEGSNVQILDISIVKKPIMMNIHGNYIYLSNLTSIWRIHKKTGKNILRVLPTFGYETQMIRGAKIFSIKSQIIDSNHPCVDNNGGCQRYCIPKPKKSAASAKINELERVCRCNNNESVDADGKKCVKNS